MSLIDDIKAGSNEAIRQLYQENAQDIYDFAKGITGNHDTAMQATKSTLTKIVRQIQSGNAPANIHAEALKIAYDEACKIAMPAGKQSAKAAAEDAVPAKPVRKKAQPAEEYEEEDDYEPAPRRRSQQSRRDDYEERQPASRRRYDDYEDDYDEGYDDYDDYEEKRGHGAGFYICLVINIILVLLLIWFLVGLLINLSVIPETSSIGNFFKPAYEWFNVTIYPLF